jgi:hypothetical protein
MQYAVAIVSSFIILLYVYCYYKNKALSIPFEFFEPQIGRFLPVFQCLTGRKGDSGVLTKPYCGALAKTIAPQVQCLIQAFQAFLFPQYGHGPK